MNDFCCSAKNVSFLITYRVSMKRVQKFHGLWYVPGTYTSDYQPCDKHGLTRTEFPTWPADTNAILSPFIVRITVSLIRNTRHYCSREKIARMTDTMNITSFIASILIVLTNFDTVIRVFLPRKLIFYERKIERFFFFFTKIMMNLKMKDELNIFSSRFSVSYTKNVNIKWRNCTF